MKFDFTDTYSGKPAMPRWSKLLRALKEESGLPLYDDSFEKWALDTWGIRCLHESAEYPGHLTGVELSEETYTMLLIRYRC